MSTIPSSKKLEFNVRHLMIIGILILAFSMSFLIRYQPADFGYELNEFDPFFNYRATQYIVENGFQKYFEWNDELSWYPHGRNVSVTSQVMLHITAAITYWLFGGGSDLYEYTIIFPIIFGSLTVVVIFALVRVVAGTTAGLISAILFSFSLPIIVRGTLGWFKSEPLGLFFGLLSLYLFLSGLNTKNWKIAFSKAIVGGIVFTFGLSSWGGIQFLVIPVGLFIMSLPYLRNDYKFLQFFIPVFTLSVLITSFGFERLASNFVFGLGGLGLIIPTVFLFVCIFIQKISPTKKSRHSLLLLLTVGIITLIIFSLPAELTNLPLPSFRYLNALNPFLSTTDPLTASVSEHASTTLQMSFFFHSMMMIFGGLGIWIIFKNFKRANGTINEFYVFSLIFGLLGVYISSSFIRLEVFASLALIILSSICISTLFKHFFKQRSALKYIFFVGVIILLMIPLVFPEQNWVSGVKAPPTILNGGAQYTIATNDWLHALEWIKTNTPKDAVIGSWWDYGYWIQTMGERASLADNSTTHALTIKKIAQLLMNSPDEGWKLLREMDADYFVIFIAGEQLNVNSSEPLYLINRGGDMSKKGWFMRIAGVNPSLYVHSDGSSGTESFWQNTLLGKMIPYSPVLYGDFQNNLQSETYVHGFIPVYVKNIKYPTDGHGPLKLVYASPSYIQDSPGHVVIGVFIYEVNKDYKPN